MGMFGNSKAKRCGWCRGTGRVDIVEGGVEVFDKKGELVGHTHKKFSERCGRCRGTGEQ